MAFNALRLGLTNLFLGLKLVWCVGLRLEDWFTRFMIFDFQFYWEVSQDCWSQWSTKKNIVDL
jgi:hypothetical protein